MQLSVERSGGRCVVGLPGPRLDAAVAAEFKRGIVELIDTGADAIVLDFGAVGFIDSSGLGAVVGAYKHLGPRGKLEIACLSPAVRKVFALTRMDRVFTIHDAVPAP
ncbi:STAS domain-containing protein [Limibaculum sp. M0105]|uniref:Anti-sigma factor antagonist n=1 Tax=Thermohalobaculum xanthum TaxID=2753746 RepID=A0A8J7S9M6_9RHOB|nr:STAS domain-containing protein [Thermohalobaculum xanthum]MBK0397618.1 STAS domain-containing protein [Thermohalobaculum xanthum]